MLWSVPNISLPLGELCSRSQSTSGRGHRMGGPDMVRCTPAAELKPNVQIFIAGATRDPGGTLEASRVTVGKDDIPPPM